MYREIIKKVYEADAENINKVKDAVDNFITSYNKHYTNTTLRIYIDNSPNFGHQTNTLLILRRLITLLNPKEVEVYYAVDGCDNSLVGKLHTLIPRFELGDYNQCIKIDGKEVLFIQYEKGERITEDISKFGFNGGFDNIYDFNLAKRFKTEYFITIQPFKWQVSSLMYYKYNTSKSTYNFHKFDEVITIGNQRKDKIIDIQQSIFYKFTYYFPDNFFYISQDAKDYYTSLKNKDRLKIPAQEAENIIQQKTHVFPVYGLHTLCSDTKSDNSFVASDFLEIMQNCIIVIVKLIISVLKLYEQHIIKQAILMLIFDDLDHVDVLSSNPIGSLFSKICECIGYILNDDKNNIIKFIHETFLIKEVDKANSIYSIFNAAINNTTLRGNNVVFLNNASVETLSTLKDETIYIYNIKNVPSCYFNYFLKDAALPPIFEGQGTSPAAIATGKPYIQINKNNAGVSNYDIILSQKSLADSISNTAENLRRYIIYYQDEPTKYNITKDILDIYDFMLASLNAQSNLSQFFIANKNYTCDMKNDKLFNAIGLMQLHIESHIKSEQLSNESSPLENIYNAIKTNINEQGILDLYNTLNNYYLVEYLQSIIEQFNIKTFNNSLTVTYDEKNQIKEVILNNSSTVLWNDCFNVYINFSYIPETKIVNTFIQCLSLEGTNIDIIPWIEFKSIGLSIIIPEEGDIASNYFSVQLKDLDLMLNAQLLSNNDVLFLEGYFDKPFSGLDLISKLAGNYNFAEYLPTSIKKITNIGVSYISFYLNLESKVPYEITVEIKPLGEDKWIFIKEPEFSIAPSITAIIHNPFDIDKRSTSFIISGDFKIGKGNINVNAQFPECNINVSLTEDKIKFTDIINLFDNSIKMKEVFEISSFSMSIMPDINYYAVKGSIDTSWNIMDLFEVKNLGFGIEKRVSAFSFYIYGVINILPKSVNAVVRLTASYNSKSGWIFLGTFSENETPLFSELFKYYLGVSYDNADFPLLKLQIKIESNTHAWQFDAMTAKPWKVPFIPDMYINASAQIGKYSNNSLFGKIEGTIVWHGIRLTLWYNYNSICNANHSFGIVWEELSAEVKSKNNQWIADISVASGTSLGSMISKMISWFKNSSGYMLEAPWNILNDINLGKFHIIYNFTKKTVSFEIRVDKINLGFAVINEIGLSYKTKEGVILTLVGSFAWQAEDTISWDVSNPDDAPNPGGNKYFNLNLLAVGQHCSIPDLYTSNNVNDAIEIIDNFANKSLFPEYSEDNNWIFAADFNILKLKEEPDYFINIKIVLCDSSLYALGVRITGEMAKVFKNFKFQIMYKKVSKTIGLFQAEITLPDRMRYLSIGAYSLTLPIFGISIYTNGDFKIDVGFPYNNNFNRSMAVEAVIYPGIPFVGAAGFYLAKLSSDTATDIVPKRDDGYYNPVVAFGFGIRAGFGKSLKTGVLDIKFEITILGIIEGVYAEFNSYKSSETNLSSRDYFYLSGTLGITGMLYAAIDFSIIKAYIHVEISVFAQIIFSTDAPIIFTIQAKLSVRGGIAINFGIFKIKISFSFKLNIKETFMIGNSDKNIPKTFRLKNNNTYVLKWDNIKAIEVKTPIYGVIAPSLTAMADEFNSEKIYPCYVITMFLKSGEPFKLICEKLCLWIGSAFENEKLTIEDTYNLNINEDKLDWLISTYLESKNILPINTNEIEKFIDEQFKIIFRSTLKSNAEESFEGIYFPAPASLNISAKNKYMDINYSILDYNTVTSQKLIELKEYFQQLSIQAMEENNIKNVKSDIHYSVGHWIFADYFTFLIKQLSQSLKKELRTYKYKINNNHSLESILKWVTNNSTVNYTLMDIAEANKEHYLTENINIIINGESYIVKSNESLSTISETKGISINDIINENSKVSGLFSFNDNNNYIILPHLSNLTLKSLLDAADINNEFENIGKLVSRMYYHGIRFSTDGISCSKPLPSQSGLYALTGQQIILPPKIEENISIDLKFNQNTNTYYFDESNSTQILIYATGNDSKRISAIYNAANSIKTIDFNNFNTSDMRQVSPYAVACTSSVYINYLSLNLPYGGKSDNIRLWYVPKSILSLSTQYVSEYDLKLSKYDDATGNTIIYDTDKYGFASIIKFKVSKVNDIDNVYVISGSSQNDIDMLTNIMHENLNENSIDDISFFFNKQIDKSNFAENPQDILFGITRSNLSYNTTDNHILKKFTSVINNKIDFIKLLWEALITNIGGYYIYYYNKNSKTGLLDSIFNEYGVAEINVIILYSILESKKINSFKNAVITGSNINNNSNVFLQASLSEIVVDYTPKDTIKDLCKQYNADITLFADYNKNIVLSKDCTLNIINSKFIVDNNYNTLSSISEHFFTTKENLISENPSLTLTENVTIGTTLKIPKTTIKIDDTNFNTILDICKYFNCLIYDLVYANKLVKGIFSGQKVTITAGPITVNSSSGVGNTEIAAKRLQPKEINDYIETSDAHEYLLHNYSLLSYKIVENQYFNESNISLSLEPYDNDIYWMYSTALPYYKFIKNPINSNPYNSIDMLLKFNFIWNDLYGNAFWHNPNDNIILTGYSDKLIPLSEWTSVTYSYKMIKLNDIPTFSFILSFDSIHYTNIDKDELKGILSKYQQLYYQLNDNNGITISISASIFPMEENTIFEFNNDKLCNLINWLFGDNSIYNYLYSIYNNLEATVPNDLITEFEFISPQQYIEKQIFEIKSSFIISRNKNIVMGGLYSLNNIHSTETPILPLSEKDSDNSFSYYKFAINYESTFDNDDFIIKIASGSGMPTSLYGIKIGKNDNGISFNFNGKPVIWGIRPISNILKSCQNPIDIYSYESGIGITSKVSNKIKAENVDLDELLKQFVDIFENILSPENINSILILDQYYNAGNILDNITRNKGILAQKFIKLLLPVLESQKETDNKVACEYFKQQLLISLSRMYNIDSIIEYTVNVNSNYYNENTTANIYGNILFDNPLPKLMQCTQLKLNLANNNKARSLFSISSPGIVKDDDGTIKSTINSNISFKNAGIENEITYIKNIEGYYSSNHLNYIINSNNPFNKDIGKITIPLLLHSYPDKPTMVSQGQMEYPKSSLHDMFSWDYSFSYKLDYHYPQDLIECIIETNIHDYKNTTSNQDYFISSLIRFLHLYPDIKQDINKYVSIIKTDNEEQGTIDYALAAIRSFDKLSSDVVNSFEYNLNDKLKANNEISFLIEESYVNIDDINALLISVSDKNSKVLIEPEKYDISLYNDTKNSYIYIDKETNKPLSAVNGQAIKERTIIYEGFNLLDTQNAKGGLVIKRNENIIPGNKTNDNFVYNTGLVTFENAYFPSIYIDKDLDISTLSKSDKNTIYYYLKLLFNDLILDSYEVTIQMQSYYCYSLNKAFDNIKYPIFMQPIEKYSKEELLNNCEVWSNYIEQWKNSNIAKHIDKSNYLFEIIIYSSYSDKPRPLLHITNIYIPTYKTI